MNKKISFYSKAKIRIINIGNGNPEKLEDYISEIEKHTGRKARKYLPFQIGDALETSAKISKLKKNYWF